jgi:ATP-binding cassette, subfamily B, bacterial
VQRILPPTSGTPLGVVGGSNGGRVSADGRALQRVDPVQLRVESRHGRRRPQALPRLLRDAVRMCWRASPRDVLTTLVPQLLGAVLLAVLLPLVRTLLDVLLVPGTGDGDRLARAAVPLCLLTGLGLVLGISSAWQSQQAKVLGEVVQRHVWGRVLDVTSRVDLVRYDSSHFVERLQRVQLNALSRPLTAVQGVISVLGGIVGTVAVTASLWVVQPAALVLLLPLPVLLLLARRGGRQEFEFAVRHAEALRLRDYLQTSMMDRGTASELRSYGLRGELRGRYERMYDTWVRDVREHASRRRRVLLAGELLTAVVTIVLLVVLVRFLDDGRLSLPQAGVVGVALPLLATRLRQFVRGVGSVLESGLFLADLEDFCTSEVERPGGPDPVDPLQTLRARSLGFRYPAGPAVLTDVDLEVRRGEVVALVGENGSGKTTLAKVLAGLYAPEAGALSWNGRDVADLSPTALRRQVAVMFQDFTRWQLSAHDNIAFGDTGVAAGPSRVEAAAREAGAWSFLAGLPAGLDTPLSTLRPGGTDLSGGQWQRVALARAAYRDASLLVLDEPSAALDARAEAELFETVRTSMRGRAVLLITHRLANVRTADRIYVLRQGKVDDVGTHEELLARGGHYARLYDVQARAFGRGSGSPGTDPGRGVEDGAR